MKKEMFKLYVDAFSKRTGTKLQLSPSVQKRQPSQKVSFTMKTRHKKSKSSQVSQNLPKETIPIETEEKSEFYSGITISAIKTEKIGETVQQEPEIAKELPMNSSD